jgi:hypothetical protein
LSLPHLAASDHGRSQIPQDYNSMSQYRLPLLPLAASRDNRQIFFTFYVRRDGSGCLDDDARQPPWMRTVSRIPAQI